MYKVGEIKLDMEWAVTHTLSIFLFMLATPFPVFSRALLMLPPSLFLCILSLIVVLLNSFLLLFFVLTIVSFDLHRVCTTRVQHSLCSDSRPAFIFNFGPRPASLSLRQSDYFLFFCYMSSFYHPPKSSPLTSYLFEYRMYPEIILSPHSFYYYNGSFLLSNYE